MDTSHEQVPLPSSSAMLRAMLDAVLAIAGDLDLHATLERIVSAAAQLAGAQYGALGVLDEDGNFLADFITVGLSAHEVTSIGALPEGHGILGAVISKPFPLRLTDLTADPDAFGFPPGHPPMSSFLGVPIRVRDRVFGNLYLTNKIGAGVFTDADTTAMVALATTAGVAIENATLYAEVGRRQHWLSATSDLQHTLLTGELGDALHTIAAGAQAASGAALCAIVLEQDDGALEVVAIAGTQTDVVARELPREGPLLEVIERGVTVSMTHNVHIPGAPQLAQALLIPFTGHAGAGGALLCGRTEDSPLFPAGRADVHALAGFAAQASLVLDRVEARDDKARLSLQSDRDRIARDLHDLVIQRLFATAMSLQAGTRLEERIDLLTRMRAAVGELDDTIKQIREAIFELSHEPGSDRSIRGRIHDVIDAAQSMLGFKPRLRIEGPIDGMLPDRIRPQLVAVLIEALANAARHAHAHSVTVVIELRNAGQLRLEVTDDGVGLDAMAKRSGLANVEQRARALGGACTIGPGPTGGTCISWSVPLDPPPVG